MALSKLTRRAKPLRILVGKVTFIPWKSCYMEKSEYVVWNGHEAVIYSGLVLYRLSKFVALTAANTLVFRARPAMGMESCWLYVESCKRVCEETFRRIDLVDFYMSGTMFNQWLILIVTPAGGTATSCPEARCSKDKNLKCEKWLVAFR